MGGPLIYGKYQLLEEIARGGMAEVYKAKSHGVEGFEKLVVIKRIAPALSRDEKFVELFIQEAKIAVTLSHANVVQVFDLGRSDESYFIAMEYVRGLDLASILERIGSTARVFPMALAAYLVSEVAKGLDYAHRRKDQDMAPLGIVHRDVSPHNILISFEGEVKLTDFGIARAMGASEIAAGRLKGKAHYLAPEYEKGETADHRADIFSLGVVLYQVLTGRSPWREDSSLSLSEQARSGGYLPLNEALPSAPNELCEVVDRTLAPDPDDRYADAGRVYEELISYLYTTGQRVDTQDVASFLTEVGITSLKKSTPKDMERGIRQSFGAPSTPTPSTPVQPEPAAAEESIRESQAVKETATAPRLTSEMREVTALAIELFGAKPSAELLDSIRSLIEQEGGSLAEDRDELVVYLFGLGPGDGRDTESAVSCALEIQRLVERAVADEEVSNSIGIGIHADRIVAIADEQPIPREDHRYYGIIDASRALASRKAATVTIGRAARAVIKDLFELRPIESGAWAVLGERPKGEVYGTFVGRTDELRRIGEVLAFCSRGAPATVMLAGESGIGKTRLLHETRQRLVSGGHDFNWYQVRPTPRPRNIPFSALAAMLRSMVGLETTDSAELVQERVERLRQLGLGTEEVEVVGHLLGAPKSGDSDLESYLDRGVPVAFKRIVSKLAEDRLTVLVWDAAERMDAQTIAALGALRQAGARSRVLVLLSSRTPLDERWDGSKIRQIDLGPLTDDEATQLACSRAGAPKLPPALQRMIFIKTAGNPFFIEEYIKALVASGAVRVGRGRVRFRSEIAEIEVPKSLRGLLVARVERFEPSLAGFLQRAAVLVHRFSPEILAAVAETETADAEEAIAELLRKGVLERAGRAEYAFVNDLLREVVQEGLTYRDRRDIHRKVATELERLYDGNLEEVAERLAVHYRESGQREKAVEFHVLAGYKLSSERAFEAALWHFLRAVELLQNMSRPDLERALNLYQQVGNMALAAEKIDLGREKMRLALELAEEVGDREATVSLLTLSGRIAEKANKYSEAHQHFDRALKLSEEMNDVRFRRSVLGSIGETLSHNGEYKQAASYLEEALALARAAGDKRHETTFLRELALCWAARGRSEEAAASIEAARLAAEALDDRKLRCEVWKSKGLVSYMVRDEEGALEAFNKALELSKEFGFRYEIAANAHNLGDLHIRREDFKAAFKALKLSYEVSRQSGFTKLEALNMMLLGYIDAINFGSEEGLARIQRALEFAEVNGYTWDEIQATYFLGKACLELGKTEQGREALRTSLRLGEVTENLLYVQDCQKLLADLDSENS